MAIVHAEKRLNRFRIDAAKWIELICIKSEEDDEKKMFGSVKYQPLNSSKYEIAFALYVFSFVCMICLRCVKVFHGFMHFERWKKNNRIAWATDICLPGTFFSACFFACFFPHIPYFTCNDVTNECVEIVHFIHCGRVNALTFFCGINSKWSILGKFDYEVI